MKTYSILLSLLFLVCFSLSSSAVDLDKNAKISLREINQFQFDSLENAITDLSKTYLKEYSNGDQYLQRLHNLEERKSSHLQAYQDAPQKYAKKLNQYAHNLKQLKREALLANPLLDIDKILVVKRLNEVKGVIRPSNKFNLLGIPSNHEGQSSLPKDGYDNEIAAFNPKNPDESLKTIWRPNDSGYVGMMDLHWNADRLLFTKSDSTHWTIWEMDPSGDQLRQVSKMPDDVDAMDACYLPNGNILFGSTASYQSVPCWHGIRWVKNLYLMDADGNHVRQVCYDQDHDFHPSVLDNGQVIFTRWDYTGISHIFFRQLMLMNPDGTGQRAIYGSNTWYPNSLFFTRQLPGKPGEFISILTGYHGVHKMGQLAIVDTQKGWHGDDGLAKRISGKGEPFEPRISDVLVDKDWPKFLHPYPLSDKYYLVSCWEEKNENWGIYLADRFDNLVKLIDDPDYAFFEPVPVSKREVPPVIPDRVNLKKDTGTVYLQDVYSGPGLQGVPRGTIKNLRLIAYDFGYRHLAGPHKIGYGGPWEAMRILGTVPLEEDGSAIFSVPANTPIAVQPIDKQGQAVQLMRSWFTVMPGELRSCVGCHESPNTLPEVKQTIAANQKPKNITQWYGPARGFDFEREVQPVLNAYCVDCHNGKDKSIPDLRPLDEVDGYEGLAASTLGHRRLHPKMLEDTNGKIKYTPAYDALLPYIRRVSVEDDVSLLVPGEYSADTSELVQMLRKGHQGVNLDHESWDRIITWIDLNAPCHGTWNDVYPVPENSDTRRLELRKMYGGPDVDTEKVPDITVFINANPRKTHKTTSKIEPLNSIQKKNLFASTKDRVMTIKLSDDIQLKLTSIPAGEFIMGSDNGHPDEAPRNKIQISEPFWMSTFEITNQQFKTFNPKHDPRYYAKRHLRSDDQGVFLNAPNQPAVRVSWHEAMAFCEWLSDKTDMRFSLPTEAQWEYACRAGSQQPFSFGDKEASFAQWGNFADKEFSQGKMKNGLQITGGVEHLALEGAKLSNASFADGAIVTTKVGSFKPNRFGLFDMHGNAAEWTASDYQLYPYNNDNTFSDSTITKVVRGGSFFDRPENCRSAIRQHYPPWRKIFNVGFRVVATGKDAQLIGSK